MNTVDARGEVCPVPAMWAVQAMRRAAAGEAVEVLLDHAPALDTIPPQAARLGWECTAHPLGEGEWRLTLQRPS